MRILCVFLVALGLAAGPIARADGLVATGNGSVQVREGRRLEARDAALGAALDDALAKAAGKILGAAPGDWTNDQNETFDAKILPQRRTFQAGFQIITDDAEPASDRYKMRVSATYDEKALKSALEESGLLKHRATTWHRIMVIIPERHLTAQIPDPAAETQIIRTFVEAGYRVVDQSQIATIRYNDQVSSAARGDNAAAAAIGRKYGAEIVIIGEAFSQDVAELQNGMHSVRAHVEARVLETDNALILSANDQNASAPEATSELASKKALGNAGSEIAKYFLDQLEKRAKAEKGEPKTIQLVISDIPYKPYVQLKELMKVKIAGVNDFHELTYEANRAELEVEYSAGDSQALAGALATTRLNGFKLTILKTTVNRVDMAAGPAARGK